MESVERQNELFKRLESSYMKRKKGETTIILENLDFAFSRSELAQINTLWLNEYKLRDIAKKIDRDENETFLALFHLSLKNDNRKTGNIKLKFSQIIG
ncbi:hypothetical protein HXA33_10025 [Salipaludibacillus agaradhaerens]|uniref:Uncharacterized protein n=1 Tax=Salipaludibacillus agaradhaerens TaxID=76935 RepID=A0A9Q4B1Y2_SALAG|nr:hypothetical protein [Salipaludibacillus agaradhaerens]